jgi:hypothetical protein
LVGGEFVEGLAEDLEEIFEEWDVGSGELIVGVAHGWFRIMFGGEVGQRFRR